MTNLTQRGIMQRWQGMVEAAGGLIVSGLRSVGVLGSQFVLGDRIVFTIAKGGSNICLVSVQVNDGSGNPVTGIQNLDLWLSDASTGLGITATTASGAVAAGASGTDLADITAKKAKWVQTTAAGLYILSITDTGLTHFYIAALAPGTGQTVVSRQLVSADYGP